MNDMDPKNNQTPLEYHFAMSATRSRLIFSMDPRVEYNPRLSRYTSSKYSLNSSHDSSMSNSLYFLVLKAKTQDIAENHMQTIPANANQWFNIFQALATKPSRTPFDASRIPALFSNSCLSCQRSDILLQAKSSITSSTLSIFYA